MYIEGCEMEEEKSETKRRKNIRKGKEDNRVLMKRS